MSTLDLLIAESAERDLLQIWVHIAEDNYDAAQAMLLRIQEIARLLCHQPEAGAARGRGVRAFPVGSYVLYYTFDEWALTVRRIIHGKRDFDGNVF